MKDNLFPDQTIEMVHGSGTRLDPEKYSNWQQDLVRWVSSQGGRRISLDSAKPSVWRLLPIWLGIVLVFVFLEARAIHLMFFQGQFYRTQAQENRFLIRRVIAPRGIIFDRNRVQLARNVPAFRLVEEPNHRLVSRQTALLLEATQAAEIVIDSVRIYPFRELVAHLVGYTSEITKEELAQENLVDYQAGDRIGRAGVEATFEKTFRGANGRELVEVNAVGEELRKLAEETAQPGNNLILTIDTRLQRVVAEALAKGMNLNNSPAGAVVASDPRHGEILSLVSLPSFNPNLFIEGEPAELNRILNDVKYPLIDRAIAGVYPPGSTIKPAVAAAGLATRTITPGTIIEDTGVINLGPYSFSNWYFTQYGKTEGPLNLVGAIRRSNDIFFYRLGERLGQEKLADWLKKFGFGQKLGIDLPGEAEGLIGSDEWKRQTYDQPWYPGDTLHLAIGQGFIQVTPLQLNFMTGVFANGGTLWQPSLTLGIESPSGQFQKTQPKAVVSEIVAPEILETVKEGMNQACRQGGTGWPFFDFPVSVGCKTGTAEVGNQTEDTHAWFTVFAPLETPEIVVTVLLEKGGEGSTNAAPIAKEILTWWFSSK